jgi:hypothetical protein
MLGMPPQAKEQLMQGWGQVSSYGYLVLTPGSTAESFQPKMDAFMKKYILPFWQQDAGFKGTMRFNLEPLRDVHFNNDLIYDTPKKGNRAYVTLLSIVAVLILAHRVHQLHQHEHCRCDASRQGGGLAQSERCSARSVGDPVHRRQRAHRAAGHRRGT